MALNIFPFAKQRCTVCIVEYFVLEEEFVCMRSHVILHLFAMTIADASVTSGQTSAAKAPPPPKKKLIKKTADKYENLGQESVDHLRLYSLEILSLSAKSSHYAFGSYARLFWPFAQLMIISITTSHVTIAIASHETVYLR
jgi:hypothetical protein